MTEPYVHTSGAGPPAVLVHGTFVGGPQSFAAQAPLAEDHRLLIVDRRGYGANPAQGETLGWPVDSEDLLRLLEELGGAHLVGHSYGGAVVAVAASRRPDLVRSLVLIEPSLNRLADDDPDVAAMLQRERGVFERAPAMSAGDWSRLWLTRVAGMPDEGADGWMGTWGEQEWAMAEVVRREAWAGAAPVDADVLAAARFPKLLVVGSKAPPTATASVRAVGRALVEALVRRIGVEVVVFEGSGHLPPVEEPERFNDLLHRAWAVPGSGGKW
ncbi:MAG TPA: alpha/beta hydrolase [Actinomycetes bacterium]|nr:alpha/beta hydrolase [Actinomycetes bacterium]